MDQLKYPIGQYNSPVEITKEHREEWIKVLAELPVLLKKSVMNLNEEQLNTEYRPGGWTIRQVIHHIADSHMNSFIRFKLSLTEDSPIIKPYDEKKWAELYDTRSAPIEISLALIESLHERWVLLLNSLNEKQFSRSFIHPEDQKTIPLDNALGLYAWHSRHHLSHITELLKRMNWD
ncbi:YfiT family bacillithiol transferase [Bacillus sp. 03113]|uniref:YfiT family bacillithiol transferase n=1 Tax=Bacillus sp. 03113 TaxID=2578211 RepID=UPI001144CE54|nr:bacillithiol transferase BstA [Bacillus sp. 03113]